jgi:anti-sigma B factor antagonist
MTIRVEQGDDSATIHLEGELDAASSGRVRQVISDCLRSYVTRIALDCNGVTFIDSGGLRAILASYKLAEGLGARLWIQSPSVPVTRLLELTGLVDRLVVPEANFVA